MTGLDRTLPDESPARCVEERLRATAGEKGHSRRQEGEPGNESYRQQQRCGSDGGGPALDGDIGDEADGQSDQRRAVEAEQQSAGGKGYGRDRDPQSERRSGASSP